MRALHSIGGMLARKASISRSKSAMESRSLAKNAPSCFVSFHRHLISRSGYLSLADSTGTTNAFSRSLMKILCHD
jgi:hypothetical protein